MNTASCSLKYFGKVSFVETKDNFEYGLISDVVKDSEFIDLEKILNMIYLDKREPKVKIEIGLLKDKYDYNPYKIVFNANGELYKNKKHGIYEWVIGNMDTLDGNFLSSCFFDLVGEYVAINLSVYN